MLRLKRRPTVCVINKKMASAMTAARYHNSPDEVSKMNNSKQPIALKM